MIYLQELKREEKKMQSTKQNWDWRIQETLVKEVLRLDPENEYIKKWCEMTNHHGCLLYTSPSPRDVEESRMPSSA